MNCALHASVICGKSCFPSPQKQQQRLQCTSRINHSRQRLMVSCFIIKGFILFVVKTVLAFYNLEKGERDAEHVVSLIINILSTEISAIVGYQFVLFSYCVQCRYEVLCVRAQQNFMDFQYRVQVANADENIQLIEDLAKLHSKIGEALDLINETFSIEVKY